MTKNRYSSIYKKVKKDKQGMAERLIVDLLFMDDTLSGLREKIKSEGYVEDFEQGRQSFTRESPALKSYNNTVKQRNQTYTQLLSLVPKEEPVPKDDGFDEFIGDRDG